MTIEQQAREWLKSDFLADANDPEYSARMLAAFARHLSSQAPGNLSEGEIERVAAMCHDSTKWRPSDAAMYHATLCLRYARDHYLSGWVATKDRLPEVGQSVLVRVMDHEPYYDVWEYEPAHRGWKSGFVAAWMPIPPYTPQQPTK